MKWSKSKLAILIAAMVTIATVAFAGPYIERAGRNFSWYIGGVEQMTLSNKTLSVDNISASDGSALFAGEPTLVAEYMTATTVTGAPAAGKFYSDIAGRAPMLDLSKIPSGKQGVERIIHKNKISLVEGEYGPSGEQVYRTSDPLDRIRYVGSSLAQNSNDQGDYIGADSQFVEVTFYGTGLNILLADLCCGSRDVRVETDGGGEGGNVVASGIPFSAVLGSRSYDQNEIWTMVRGLPLGIHTVKVRGNPYLRVYGFEILNEAATVAIPEGSIVDRGKKYTTTATTDDLTTFAAQYQDGVSTTAKTVGGHVVRYFDTDGTIKKAINYADSTQLNLGAASHANEEVVQRFNWREFGAGRADDFSTLDAANRNAAFTLDDGTTTLVAENTRNTGPAFGHSQDAFILNGGVGQGVIFTFVGTGLNIIADQAAAGSADDYDIYVDGSNVGVWAESGVATKVDFPIVSGLPFGTHTVHVDPTNIGFADVGFIEFVVYAPKKPTLAAGQVEIDSTYKMADFVENATTNNALTISPGVMRKNISTREGAYSGSGWGLALTPSEGTEGNPFGFRNISPTNGNSVSYTFHGEGFDLRHQTANNASSNILVTINGTAATTANFATATFSSYGPGVSYSGLTGSDITATTNVLSQKDPAFEPGMGFIVSGLPLATYTVTFTNQGNPDQLFINGIDIITPTYSYKNNILNLSDDIVGSNSLKNEILIPGATKNKIIATAGIEAKDSIIGTLTVGAIVGSDGRSSAAAGDVGEYLEVIVNSGGFTDIVDGTVKNVNGLTLALTAGEWLCTYYLEGSASSPPDTTTVRASVSTVSATHQGGPGQSAWVRVNGATSLGIYSVTAQRRILISSPQTLYAVVQGYAPLSGNLRAYGTLTARRIR